MIIAIENYNGEAIGYCRIIENPLTGDSELIDIKGNIYYADKEFDSIFDTNEYMFRIQLAQGDNND